jgi:hypothetical protein
MSKSMFNIEVSSPQVIQTKLPKKFFQISGIVGDKLLHILALLRFLITTLPVLFITNGKLLPHIRNLPYADDLHFRIE